MLDVAFMGLHVAQMSAPDEMRKCFQMVTSDNAAIIGLEGYGLEVGARASLVVLDAGDPVEALRLRADRLWVISNGVVVASEPRREAACGSGSSGSTAAQVLPERFARVRFDFARGRQFSAYSSKIQRLLAANSTSPATLG